MRSEDEIQKAHDVLVAVIAGELDRLDMSAEQRTVLTYVADAFCWVLSHEHNDRFARNYAELLSEAEESGYTLVEAPAPMTKEQWDDYRASQGPVTPE